jgi:hypothetical protein
VSQTQLSPTGRGKAKGQVVPILVTHSRANGFRGGNFIPSVVSRCSVMGAQPKKKEMNRAGMVKNRFLGIIGILG